MTKPKCIMNRWHKSLFRILLILPWLLWTGCNKPPGESAGATADTIKVGEFASLNGSEAGFGRSSHNGTLLAVEQINAAGGVRGKKLDLITEDDQSKDGESATAVK